MRTYFALIIFLIIGINTAYAETVINAKTEMFKVAENNVVERKYIVDEDGNKIVVGMRAFGMGKLNDKQFFHQQELDKINAMSPKEFYDTAKKVHTDALVECEELREMLNGPIDTTKVNEAVFVPGVLKRPE